MPEELYPWEHERPLVPQAQLCVPVRDDPTPAVAAARRWYELGFETLGGSLRERVLALSVAERDWSSRAPGAVNAGIVVRFDDTGEDYDRSGRRPDYEETYSEASWRFLQERLAELPSSATFEIRTNDAKGRPGSPWMHISSRKMLGTGAWLELNMIFDNDYYRSSDGQAEALRFMRAVAEGCGPSHGEISFTETVGRTALEEALALLPSETVPRSGEVLRSYGWLTIAAEELGQRLGGLEALRDSGAFYEVEHLANGGYWLRATERWEEYGRPEAERLFEVLAPVLPPGRPQRPRGSHNFVAERDPRELVG